MSYPVDISGMEPTQQCVLHAAQATPYVFVGAVLLVVLLTIAILR
jgi:hypothetical protein